MGFLSRKNHLKNQESRKTDRKWMRYVVYVSIFSFPIVAGVCRYISSSFSVFRSTNCLIPMLVSRKNLLHNTFLVY